MESTHYERFKVFIASPSDVEPERIIAERVIGNANHSCRDSLGLMVDCLNWKHLSPVALKPDEGSVQNLIIEELVRNCNVFVLILHKRYGSTEPGQKRSNTEREVNTALKMLGDGRNIMLLCYFKETETNPDPGEQEKEVVQLKARLAKRKLLFSTFKTSEEFLERFTNDLYNTILRFKVSTRKRKALSVFWQLGISEGDEHPKLNIVYPPISRAVMMPMNPDTIWLTRLAPHIVFEDHRAIQKIDKTLRILDFRHFSAYTVPCAPSDIQEVNRAWICLPRNRPGLKQLELYSQRARFRVKPPRGGGEAVLYWRPPGTGAVEFEIRSPLVRYLEIQRSGMPGGEWRAQHARIVAKDYAVLARFSDRRQDHPTTAGTLKDYFVFGIRGLGTWGAGWFIDRRYDAFLQFSGSPDVDIQMLLEVTYLNERIAKVTEVSDKGESYFRDALLTRTIRNHIKNEAGA